MKAWVIAILILISGFAGFMLCRYLSEEPGGDYILEERYQSALDSLDRMRGENAQLEESITTAESRYDSAVDALSNQPPKVVVRYLRQALPDSVRNSTPEPVITEEGVLFTHAEAKEFAANRLELDFRRIQVRKLDSLVGNLKGMDSLNQVVVSGLLSDNAQLKNQVEDCNHKRKRDRRIAAIVGAALRDGVGRIINLFTN